MSAETRAKQLRESARWYSETNWLLDAREHTPLNNYSSEMIRRAFEAARDFADLLESASPPDPTLPRKGTTWIWEPLKPHARESVVVTEVKWNGEEWWVESESVRTGERHWNELSRWVEATVFSGADEPERCPVERPHECNQPCF